MDAANEKRTSVYAAEMKLTHGDLTVDYAPVTLIAPRGTHSLLERKWLR